MKPQGSNRSQDWWKRQLVQRSIATLPEDMERIINESPFLSSHPPRHVAKFDRSEIVTGRVLGKGGFSVVYEVIGFDLDSFVSRSLSDEERKLRQSYARNAFDSKTKRSRFVIKYLRPETVRNAFREAANDLVLEGEYLSRLEHENIISLHGLPVHGMEAWRDGLHDGYFLILDRLTETLDHCLNNKISKAPTALQKMEYAFDLASAMEYLHNNGIVFRDLKTNNLGFSATTGRLQLFDFGLARELPGDGDQVYEMSGVGTRRYMAPEVIRFQKYNCKVDVYSWSMVVWQLFTHCKPYSLYSPVDHARHVCLGGERPPLGKGLDIHGDLKASLALSPFLRKLLADCWVESIHDRCSMAEVKHRMQRELAKLDGSFFCTEATPEGIEVTISFDLGSIRVLDDVADDNDEDPAFGTVSCTNKNELGESFDDTQSSLSLAQILTKEHIPANDGCYPMLKRVLSGSTCSTSGLSAADSFLSTYLM